MAFQTAFLELMPHSVVVTPFSKYSTAGTGTPTYGTASTYRARVVSAPTWVRDAEGQDILTTHTMWVASTGSVGAMDRVSYQGTTFKVVEAAHFTDEDGPHHIRLRCRG